METKRKIPNYIERGGIEDENVTLFNGKLSASVPLFELGGVGPSYSFEVNYNYSIDSKMTYEKWNDLWVPDVTGINWMVNKPDKIVRFKLEENVNNVEELISSEDLYWVSDGGMSQLCHKETLEVDGESQKLIYIPKGTPDILIERNLNLGDLHGGSWEILFPSGMRYKFDSNAEGTEEDEYFLRVKDELQKVSHNYSIIKPTPLGKEVLWNNGIWFSKYLSTHLVDDITPENQNEIINEWNLTSMEDLWGNSTEFHYISELMPVGEKGKQATVCSYPYKVENSNGNKLILNYKARDSKEIIKKHRICQDPNGYQEKLEKLFLTSIDMIQREGVVRKEFEYSEINSDTDYSKRILSEIKSKIYSRDISNFIEHEPSYIFEYYDQKDGVSNSMERGHDFLKGGGLFGALKSITYPSGVKTAYEYERLSLREEVQIGRCDITEEDGLQEIEHIATSEYFLLSGKRGGNKILRLHDWTIDGWNTMDLYETTSNERDFFAQGKCEYSGNCISFVTDTGDVVIYEKSTNDMKSWIQTKRISESNIASGEENLPIISMGEDTIIVFYPNIVDETYKLLKVLKRDRITGFWEEEIVELQLDGGDFDSSGVQGNQEFNITQRGRIIAVGHIFKKDDKPWVNLVVIKLNSDMSGIESKATYAGVGSYLYDRGSTESEFCRAGAAVKPKGFNNISIMDNYIALYYETTCEYSGGEMFYEYNWAQIYSYDSVSMTINPHPIQEDILNVENFPVKESAAKVYYIPNFSMSTGNQFLTCSYSIGTANSIDEDSESGLGHPNVGEDDNERHYEKYKTKTIAYIYNGVNWEKRLHNGGEWEVISPDVTNNQHFNNLGLTRFGSIDVGIFSKTHQVVPNTHGDIDTQQKEFVVYDESKENFQIRYLPTAPQEERKIGEDDIEEHPDEKRLRRRRRRLNRRRRRMEIAEAIILGYATGGATAGTSIKSAAKNVAGNIKDNIISNIIGKLGPKGRMDRRIKRTDAKIAELQYQMYMQAVRDASEITSYASNFDRFLIEEDAVLYRDYNDNFVVASDQLSSGTGGKLMPHSFFSPDTDIVAFLTKNEEDQITGWVKYLRNNKISDMNHSFWIDEFSEVGSIVEAFGADYSLIIYNTCHKKYNEGKTECEGEQPKAYSLFKFHNDFSSYDKTSVDWHVQDYVVSKTKVLIDPETEYEVDYRYKHSDAPYINGVGGIYSKVWVAFDAQNEGLGDYIKEYNFYNGTEDEKVEII